MIKTFIQAKEDFYMIAYYHNIPNSTLENNQLYQECVNAVRVHMNKTIEDLLKCIK
jgi:hypothetical protein